MAICPKNYDLIFCCILLCFDNDILPISSRVTVLHGFRIALGQSRDGSNANNPRGGVQINHITMTSSNGNILRVTYLFCGDISGHRWIPDIEASDAELWICFWYFRYSHHPLNFDDGYNMMTSSNENIFRVTGPLCGEFTGPGEFPAQGQWRGALMFSVICAWINDWVNNCEAGDLRGHLGHYDVYVVKSDTYAYLFGGKPLPDADSLSTVSHRSKIQWNLVQNENHFRASM